MRSNWHKNNRSATEQKKGSTQSQQRNNLNDAGISDVSETKKKKRTKNKKSLREEKYEDASMLTHIKNNKKRAKSRLYWKLHKYYQNMEILLITSASTLLISSATKENLYW